MAETTQASPAPYDALFGVFDGHSGDKASEFCRMYASKALLKEKRILSSDPSRAIKSGMQFIHFDYSIAIKTLDRKFLKLARAKGLTDGSTCLLAMI